MIRSAFLLLCLIGGCLLGGCAGESVYITKFDVRDPQTLCVRYEKYHDKDGTAVIATACARWDREDGEPIEEFITPHVR